MPAKTTTVAVSAASGGFSYAVAVVALWALSFAHVAPPPPDVFAALVLIIATVTHLLAVRFKISVPDDSTDSSAKPATTQEIKP